MFASCQPICAWEAYTRAIDGARWGRVAFVELSSSPSLDNSNDNDDDDGELVLLSWNS